MQLTIDGWKVFATKFFASIGVDVQTDDWIDIEIAAHHNAGKQGISKKFLLMAAKLIRAETVTEAANDEPFNPKQKRRQHLDRRIRSRTANSA